MSRFTKFALLTLAAFLYMGLFTASTFATPPPKVSTPVSGERSYYLTIETFNGSQTLEACAEGYHFASIYELWDVSGLSYNTELGVTTEDSGQGPPAWVFGFYRTGMDTSDPVYNCSLWTDDTNAANGVVAAFKEFLDVAKPDPGINPMDFAWKGMCSGSFSVWCISD